VSLKSEKLWAKQLEPRPAKKSQAIPHRHARPTLTRAAADMDAGEVYRRMGCWRGAIMKFI